MTELSFTVQRSRRRTLSVEVEPWGTVTVRAPLSTSMKVIREFVVSKSNWITARVKDAEARRSIVPQRTEHNHIHHRGNVCTWGWTNADIIIPQRVTTIPHALRWLDIWQRDQARTMFERIIQETLPGIGLPGLRYQGCRIRKMKRRWGACSTTGTVTLNEFLVQLPDGCIRSVIAHELCHLVHFNHGRDFYALMDDVYPEHRLADAIINAWSAQADVFAQISSKALVSDAAIISGDLPSI